MIDWLLLASASASAVVSGAIAWTVAGRRARARAERACDAKVAVATSAREEADRRALTLDHEVAYWRATSLAPRELAPAAVFHDRMAASEHEVLVALLRGLCLVDAAVIADATGLSRTREGEGEASSLAALAALAGPFDRLQSTLERLGLAVAEARLETLDTTHVTIRPLGGRARGSFLVAKGPSLPVNPLAVDAVAHSAAGKTLPTPLPRLVAGWRGSSDKRRASNGGPVEFFDDLEREMERANLRAAVLGEGGAVYFSAAEDGPSADVRASAFMAMNAFQERAAPTLRGAGLARVDLVVASGGVLRWSALPGARNLGLVLLADDGATSPAWMERLSGRLRRGLDATAARASSSGPALERAIASSVGRSAR